MVYEVNVYYQRDVETAHPYATVAIAVTTKGEIYRGLAICSENEQFDKNVGRELALRRVDDVIHNLPLCEPLVYNNGNFLTKMVRNYRKVYNVNLGNGDDVCKSEYLGKIEANGIIGWLPHKYISENDLANVRRLKKQIEENMTDGVKRIGGLIQKEEVAVGVTTNPCRDDVDELDLNQDFIELVNAGKDGSYNIDDVVTVVADIVGETIRETLKLNRENIKNRLRNKSILGDWSDQ